jgi:hypothetical protein
MIFWLDTKEPSSSVSIVFGYGLHDGAIEFPSAAEARYFSFNLLCPDRLWSPPASCTMGIGGPFPGAKARPGRDADHSPPSSTEVDNE